jgi:hypothetical protein
MNALLAISLLSIAALLALEMYAALQTARRLVRDDGRLRFTEALRGQGLALPSSVDELAVRSAALAARRCVACGEHERCDKVLAESDWKGLRAICPNTAYFDIAPAPR